MGSTQDLYAANLLQHCGYPLHSPAPTAGLDENPYQTEGFQIGDVGYINREGEFYPLFNICSPIPDKLRDRGFPEHQRVDFDDLYRKPHALPPGHVFMTGVNQEVNLSSSEVAYKFTAESNAGAVLILPSGATLHDLPQDKYYLDIFREAATKYAHLWCKRSEQHSLYLVTGMYKTRNFILTSFNTGRSGKQLLVKTIDGKYEWKCGFTAYSRIGSPKNEPENQTVLIKGFRMTMRLSYLPVVEEVTPAQSRISRWIAFLFAVLAALFRAVSEMVSTLLRRSSIEHIPPLTLLHHPSDSINRYLLDKNPRALVAITHDNEWIDIIERGRLAPGELMQEDQLRAFLDSEYRSELDPDSGVVSLQSQIGNPRDIDQNSESSQPISTPENAQAVVTHMRAENVTVGLERVPIGFYVQVDIDDRPCKQTKNKSILVYDHVIQWDDMIHLPSDPSTAVKLTICASYEFSPMLGRGEPLHVLDTTVGELLDHTGPFTLSDKEEEDVSLCPSLLVAAQEWHCGHQTLGSNKPDLGPHEWPAQVTEATNKGREYLLCYYTDQNEEDLKNCVKEFNDALASCLDEHSCRAAALFNLATAEFITYQSYGTPNHFEESIAHYQEALKLRHGGHQDRPMTLLHLAQVLLYHSRTMGSDAIHTDELSKHLQELTDICPEGTHGRRAADLVFQTHALVDLCNADDLVKLDELIATLDAAAKAPPEGYFDRPARFNNLGLALQKRFQLAGHGGDLDRAVAWFEKGVGLVPGRHPDRAEYLSNLSDALLARSQRERAVPLTGKW